VNVVMCEGVIVGTSSFCVAWDCAEARASKRSYAPKDVERDVPAIVHDAG
jgi:hypothetical protein